MPVKHKYTITYKYPAPTTEITEVCVEKMEYIKAWTSNGITPPATIITYEQEFSEHGHIDEIVEITWKGGVVEGFYHTAPVQIPKGCLLILSFSCNLLGDGTDDTEDVHNDRDSYRYNFSYPVSDRMSGITIPDVNNAVAVISDVIPLELHTDLGNFIPFFGPVYEPEYDTRPKTLGYFKREISLNAYKQTFMALDSFWKERHESEEIQEMVQMH